MSENQKVQRELQKISDKQFLLIMDDQANGLRTEKKYTDAELKDIHKQLVDQIKNLDHTKAETTKQIKKFDPDAPTEPEKQLEQYPELAEEMAKNQELLDFASKAERAGRLKQFFNMRAQLKTIAEQREELDSQRREIETAIPVLLRNKK